MEQGLGAACGKTLTVEREITDVRDIGIGEAGKTGKDIEQFQRHLCGTTSNWGHTAVWSNIAAFGATPRIGAIRPRADTTSNWSHTADITDGMGTYNGGLRGHRGPTTNDEAAARVAATSDEATPGATTGAMEASCGATQLAGNWGHASG